MLAEESECKTSRAISARDRNFMMLPAFIALGACLLLVMLLAASEAALAANNRVHLRHVLQSQAASSDDGEAVQKLSGELSGDAQRFIAMVTIAGNVPLLAAASLVVYLARELSGGTAAVLWCAAAALATVVFFQIAPRLLTSHAGSGATLWWLRPAWLLVAALRFPVLALLWLGAFTLRLAGLNPKPKSAESAQGNEDETDIGLATPEIRDLVESAQSSGALQEENRELIESIFDFGDTRVHDVMIPRPIFWRFPKTATCREYSRPCRKAAFRDCRSRAKTSIISSAFCTPKTRCWR